MASGSFLVHLRNSVFLVIHHESKADGKAEPRLSWAIVSHVTYNVDLYEFALDFITRFI